MGQFEIGSRTEHRTPSGGKMPVAVTSADVRDLVIVIWGIVSILLVLMLLIGVVPGWLVSVINATVTRFLS